MVSDGEPVEDVEELFVKGLQTTDETQGLTVESAGEIQMETQAVKAEPEEVDDLDFLNKALQQKEGK